MKENILYLDIETLPPQDRQPDPDDVTPPANYKNPETIRAYQESKAEEVYRKLATNPLDAQVLVIGVAYGDDKAIGLCDTDEKALFDKLEEYLATLQFNIESTKDLIKKSPDSWTIVGHNVAQFDLPILMLRAKKYGGTLTNQLLRDLTPFDHRIADTMRMAMPTMKGSYVSMDDLCGFFGLEGKGDMDGSTVYDYFKEGKIDDIIKYCIKDVETTRKLYKILL